MNGISEILKTGIAPGVRCGRGAVDRDSVFYKAPKALKELESEPIFKRGPARGAGRINKLFGMSTSTIRRAWGLGCVLALLTAQCAYAGDLTPGETFTDRQTVYASDLNNAIGGATLNSGGANFISRQTLLTPNLSADYFVGYNPIAQETYKATLISLVQSPLGVQLLSPGMPNYTNADLFSFYSSSVTNLANITFQNLVQDIASNINPVAWMQFAPTNNPGATNLPVLANWPAGAAWSFSGWNTNNQPFILAWASNGVPYQQPLSNLDAAIQSDNGTNPFVFRQIFQPWNVYGTNSTGFTNAWYGPTNFAITNLFIGTNQTATLTDTDAVPVFANAQTTNTTATMLSIYEYMTNKNALPPYTVARIQFSGIAEAVVVSNTASSANGLIQVATNIFQSGVIYCVDFATNGAQVQITGVQTNTPYYVVSQATNNEWLHVYTNLSAAKSLTNFMTVANTGSGTSPMNYLFYLTNYTSFNADVTAVITLGNPPVQAYTTYDVWFRSPAANALYYVTGVAMSDPTDGYPIIVSLSLKNIITTNRFRITAARFDGYYLESGYQSPLIQVLVNPQ
jgi:hypothetical protein